MKFKFKASEGLDFALDEFGTTSPAQFKDEHGNVTFFNVTTEHVVDVIEAAKSIPKEVRDWFFELANEQLQTFFDYMDDASIVEVPERISANIADILQWIKMIAESLFTFLS